MTSRDLAVLALFYLAYRTLNEASVPTPSLHQPEFVPSSNAKQIPEPVQGRLAAPQEEDLLTCPLPYCRGVLDVRERDSAKWCTRCETVYYETLEEFGDFGPDLIP